MKDETEVRLVFRHCEELDEEYLGYVGQEGDYLVFDRPKGGQVLIHKDDFKKELPHKITFR